MKSKRESSAQLLCIYICVCVRTLFYSPNVSQTNPRFQGCIWRSCCCNRNFWDLGMILPLLSSRTRSLASESSAWKKIAGQFLSLVGREWNESVTSTWSYRPLLGRAPAAVTLATHVHFLLHRKGRVSPRRGAVCARPRDYDTSSPLLLFISVRTVARLEHIHSPRHVAPFRPRQNFHPRNSL